MLQLGGGKCTLCGSEGVNRLTCPLNPDAKNPNSKTHPLAAPVDKPKPVPKPVPVNKPKPVPKPVPVDKPKPVPKVMPKPLAPKAASPKMPTPKAASPIIELDDIKTPRETQLNKAQCESWLKNPGVDPITGRFLKPDGTKFKSLVEDCAYHGVIVPVPKGSFSELTGCLNDDDFIEGAFEDLPEEDYEFIVKLSSGHCFALDSIFGWYEDVINRESDHKAEFTNPITNLVAPQADVDLILDYKRQQDPSFVIKKKEKEQPDPKVTLEITQGWHDKEDLHEVYINDSGTGARVMVGRIRYNLSTGADFNSDILMFLLMEAYNNCKLFVQKPVSGNLGNLLTGTILDQTRDLNKAIKLWFTKEGTLEKLINQIKGL